ncbi:helix-turn-helix transcriptional regulator [Halomonas pacifica]|uniref:helix-turn-helix domain-containing protein n=1 Tax=Bisbaumannia pacifica TaxID=77098 RepID=UPI002358DCFD|nr:helix-turn-helix transcriptional regulator [Halomonas pacifica]MDC8804257.1 helix-turn-helix transcriptional regulator [Halomonas pacifica]
MTTRNEDVGHRLKLIRGELSQAAFADKVGVHKNTLGGYERGERSPDAEILRALVGLGYNANWVLTGEGPERLTALGDAYTGVGEPEKVFGRTLVEDVDHALLQAIVMQVRESEIDQGILLSPKAFTKVIIILYRSCAHNAKPPDPQTVREMVELAQDIQ